MFDLVGSEDDDRFGGRLALKVGVESVESFLESDVRTREGERMANPCTPADHLPSGERTHDDGGSFRLSRPEACHA
jgi:hypothetical protein